MTPVPSVVTASAIAWITSSRLKRGEMKGNELLSVRQIFHSMLKSVMSECCDSHLGRNSRAGHGAGH